MGRKQLEADILDAAPPTIEPGSKQRYARVLGPRGNHQHEVEFTDGHRTLVTLQPRFRHIVWVKRGHFVLVDPSIGTTSEKVGGEIIFVYFPQHIKQLEQAGQWPEEFSQKKKHDEDEDDLLFVNNNRPVMSETESESSDEE
ncbi:nucleic acid-binding protein [Lichtheimia hyalospora FSU 10163]|nr:nucleic acid-binding protein [Lichtheimia hyalospora FSU 10163]